MSETTVESSPARDAVRSYLLFLRDPSALVDVTAQQQLQAEADAADDPLDRLVLLSRLRASEKVDGQDLERAFVKYAAEYARTEGVIPQAFTEMGVSSAVLRAAGLLDGKGRKRSRTQSRERSKPRERTDSASVAAAVPAAPFTLRTLQELSGASALTVRKVVEGLVRDGSLVSLGADPEHSGRGRSPNLYQRASTPEVQTSPTRRSVARKAPAKKSPAQKSPAQKSTAQKASAKKAPASRRRSTTKKTS